MLSATGMDTLKHKISDLRLRSVVAVGALLLLFALVTRQVAGMITDRSIWETCVARFRLKKRQRAFIQITTFGCSLRLYMIAQVGLRTPVQLAQTC